MLRFPHLASCTALALCLPASAALADLTAAEVWSDWKDTMASSGYDLSALEATSGNTVTVTDMSLEMELSDDSGEGVMSMMIPNMRFVENGDGTVTIELPAISTIDMRMRSDADEEVAFTIAATLTDPVMTGAGDPGNLTYNYSTARSVLELTDLTVDGVTLGRDIASASVTMDDTAYILTSVTDGLRALSQTANIGAVSYQVSFKDPDNSDNMALNGNVRDVAFEGGVDLPTGVDPQDINAMLNAGFGFGGMFTSQGGGYDATFNSEGSNSTVNSTSEGAEFNVALDPDGLIYDFSQTGIAVNMLVSEFPVPLTFAADELAASVQLPVQKSDTPQDFGMGLLMGGITISDTIWGMFDPAGQLPRSPANLVLDLSGTAKVLFDFLDPAQAEVIAETGAVPGELNAMSLDALEVDLAGARLTGAGAFTFDNGDLVTFDGMPRPEGAVDLTLTGGNTLLDTLVNMGFVPQDQAMGARMMMGLFAVPGEGEDTLNSTIEVNPEGHVLANGQRLR